MAVLQGAPVTYWGTTSGNPLPEKDLEIMEVDGAASSAPTTSGCSPAGRAR